MSREERRKEIYSAVGHLMCELCQEDDRRDRIEAEVQLDLDHILEKVEDIRQYIRECPES